MTKDSHLSASLCLHRNWNFGIGSIRNSRLPSCSLKKDEEQKLGRGDEVYRSEAGTYVTALEWYNKLMYLISAYRGRHPAKTVKRWPLAERFQDQHWPKNKTPT
jgi:hypothetical protein